MALTDGIKSHWRCDEASGNLIDVLGVNTLLDSDGSGSLAGKIGTSREISAGSLRDFSKASDSHCQTGDIEFAFAGWFYSNLWSGNRRILSKINSSASILEFQFFQNAGTHLRWEVFASGSLRGQAQLAFSTTSAWTFFFVWHSAASNQVGLRINDGAPVVVSTSGPLATTSAPFHIGSMAHVFGTFLDGRVDSITFWKGYVPTSAEQSELWNGGNGLDYDDFAGGTYSPHARNRRFRFGGRPLTLAA